MPVDRILCRAIASIQRRVGLSPVGQGWAMGAAKRVDSIQAEPLGPGAGISELKSHFGLKNNQIKSNDII